MVCVSVTFIEVHSIILSPRVHTQQLVSTVNESLGDLQGLHSKLDRKTCAEENNMVAVGQFRRNIHSRIGNLGLELDKFVGSRHEAYGSFSNNIGRLFVSQPLCKATILRIAIV